MATFSILHLSDLHWSDTRKGDAKIVIDGLLADLKRLRTNKQLRPDLVVFSGDLVLAGQDKASFAGVRKAFIDPLMNELNLVDDRFFIVPGNHDIDRQSVRDAKFIDAGLKSTLASPDSINSFIDDISARKPSVESALIRMNNYEKFHKTLKNSNLKSNGSLIKAYIVPINDIKIGIACFNTAWRATGEPDDVDLKNIILGERNVDIAVEALNTADFRIAVYHHPFDWLSNADELSVTSRIFSQFDLLMCGHIHRSSPEARIVSTGSAILSQTGSLYEHRRHFNGYQIVTIETGTATASFNIRTWFDAPRRSFDAAGNVVEGGLAVMRFTPSKEDGTSIQVERVLRDIRSTIRENASQHISIADSGSVKLGATEAFICPPLAHGHRDVASHVHPEDLSPAKKKGKEDDDEHDDEDGGDDVAPEEILKRSDNQLIVGSREAGKTSLAHYLAVLVAEGVVDRPRIPIVVDFRALRLNSYGVQRAVASYVGATETGLDVKAALKEGWFIFFVDNFTGANLDTKKSFAKLVSDHPGNRWIMLADSRFGGTDPERENSDLTPDTLLLRIRDLPRRSIRELAARWCSKSGGDSDRVFTSVMKHLKAGNLPRTGYIVTLLLWAVYQEQKFERINESLLLTNILDHLLGKADFTKSLEREFDPSAKEITLQSLAKYLHRCGGISEKNDVTAFLIGFFKKKGLRHVASDTIESFIDCGILVDSPDGISFKYRVFQDYFYAQLLRSDASELASVLSDFEYHKFLRELELLSGLRRQNSDLIKHISDCLENSCPPEIAEYEEADFSEVAASPRIIDLSMKQISDIRKRRLTAREIDDMMDAADRNVSERQSRRRQPERANDEKASEAATDKSIAAGEERNTMSPSVFMTSVSLLGRVVRNSEFTDALEKLKAVRLYLAMQRNFYLFYGDVLDDVIVEIVRERKARESANSNIGNEEDVILYIFRRIFLVSIMDQCYHEIGTEKLSEIFNEILKINDVGTFEILSLTFFSFDLSEKDWLKKWRKVVDVNRKNDFTIDLLVDKIWRSLHTRYISAGEMVDIEKMAGELESVLGRPKHSKGKFLELMRETSSKTNEKLDGR